MAALLLGFSSGFSLQEMIVGSALFPHLVSKPTVKGMHIYVGNKCVCSIFNSYVINFSKELLMYFFSFHYFCSLKPVKDKTCY